MPTPPSPLEILLVEDRLADQTLARRAIAKATTGLNVRVTTASHGQQAVDMLQGGLVPHLILLDWMMPILNGIDVLRWVRSHKDREIASTPVLVLTTSSSPIDVSDAYAEGANSYMAKPVQPRDFEAIIQNTLDYWTKTVELP